MRTHENRNVFCTFGCKLKAVKIKFNLEKFQILYDLQFVFDEIKKI